mgnify:FL=1
MEGSPANSCFFIVQGEASVVKNKMEINKMGRGEIFGEIALLRPGQKRTSSVIAISEMILMVIQSDKFHQLLASNLSLALQIEKIANQRLLNDRMRAAEG